MRFPNIMPEFAPKKEHNHIAYFLCGQCYTGKIGFLTHVTIFSPQLYLVCPENNQFGRN
jgi:hypothetical protein